MQSALRSRGGDVMDVRFEDHAQFQRSAGLAALGGGVVAMVAPQLALAPAAVMGAAVALAIVPFRPWRMAAAFTCVLAALAWLVGPRVAWLVPLCGAMLGVLFALARSRTPSGWAIAATAALGAGATALSSIALPPLAGALSALVPGWLATSAAGAAFGLWAGLAALPLHVVVGGDPVEARLRELRPSLTAEARGLAERALAARRGAFEELPDAELRGLIDSLALAALDVAGRVASLSRSASPAVEEELQRRATALSKSAAETGDAAARQSYERAREALEGQLDHFRRVRCARERALARLHEDVANLERARFSLTLLGSPEGAAEVDLLRDRLQHGTLAFEEMAPPRVRA